jgi:alanine-glyoxylate transaminase/serine-glyoxylate transaminase/serine-pyruvate transaminase
MTFHQVEHPLLVIPGPIEVSDDVLFANASPSQSHMSKSFTATFGAAIKMFRQVLVTETGQPFIVAGSGTLGWDIVAANLIEPGDEALVLNSGYFGQSFADCLEAYGAKVTQLKAPIGQCPSREQVTEALTAKKYKVVTVTHVDTSTGVLSNPQMVAEVVREVSPDTLVVLDGVCSVGSEEIRMDEWSLDVVMCASQKGLGVPPGLCLVCASEKAIHVVETRKTKINAYFVSWLKWLPGKYEKKFLNNLLEFFIYCSNAWL